MQSVKKRWVAIVLACTLLLSGVLALIDAYTSRAAATSFTDAYAFYMSTGQVTGDHFDTYGGSVYYATRAKKATSNGLRYGTLGFDVSLTGNGKTINFSVKRNGVGNIS